MESLRLHSISQAQAEKQHCAKECLLYLAVATTQPNFDESSKTEMFRIAAENWLRYAIYGGFGTRTHSQFSWDIMSLLSGLNLGRLQAADSAGEHPTDIPRIVYAASIGHTELVKVCIMAHDEIEASGSDGHTALTAACKYGHVEIVNVLLSRGANASHLTIGSSTALEFAARSGSVNILRLLLEVPGIKSNINHRSADGWTALIVAITYGHIDFVQALCANGADINLQSLDGQSPLMHAARYNRTEIIYLLTWLKARVHGIQSCMEETVFDLCQGKPSMGVLARFAPQCEGGEEHPTSSFPAAHIPVNFRENYAIGRALDAGGFGSVFTCRSKTTGQEFAVKIFSPRVNSDLNMPQRYEIRGAEAEIEFYMRRYQHENLCTMTDCFYDSSAGYCFIVMPLADGSLLGYLHDRVHGNRNAGIFGGLTARECRNIFKQVITGIKFLHDQGLVHRDLKPGNILMFKNPPGSAEEYTYKLTDFGMIMSVDQRGLIPYYTGTTIYRPVESFVRGPLRGKPCDIYAWAVSMFELLSGLTPFHANRVSKDLLIEHIEAGCIGYPSWMKESLPEYNTFFEFLDRALIPEGSSRGSADEWLEWVAAWESRDTLLDVIQPRAPVEEQSVRAPVAFSRVSLMPNVFSFPDVISSTSPLDTPSSFEGTPAPGSQRRHGRQFDADDDEDDDGEASSQAVAPQQQQEQEHNVVVDSGAHVPQVADPDGGVIVGQNGCLQGMEFLENLNGGMFRGVLGGMF